MKLSMIIEILLVPRKSGKIVFTHILSRNQRSMLPHDEPSKTPPQSPDMHILCALLRAIQQYLGAKKLSQNLLYVLIETKSQDKSEETSVLTSHAVEKGEETMPKG